MNDNEIPEGYLPDSFRKPKAPLPSRSDAPGEIQYVRISDPTSGDGPPVEPLVFAGIFLLTCFLCLNFVAALAGVANGCDPYGRCAPRARWRYVFPGFTAGAMLRDWLDAKDPLPMFSNTDTPYLPYCAGNVDPGWGSTIQTCVKKEKK